MLSARRGGTIDCRPSSQNGGPHRELHSSPRAIWVSREEEGVGTKIIFKPLQRRRRRRRRSQMSVFSMLDLLIEKKERGVASRCLRLRPRRRLNFGSDSKNAETRSSSDIGQDDRATLHNFTTSTRLDPCSYLGLNGRVFSPDLEQKRVKNLGNGDGSSHETHPIKKV
jgi:hypothetical protein